MSEVGEKTPGTAADRVGDVARPPREGIDSDEREADRDNAPRGQRRASERDPPTEAE